MSDENTPPAEAARALEDIERRRAQARTAQSESRWVGAVFALAIFAQLAAPDFFGEGVSSTVNVLFAVLVVAYVVMLRTRRGSALLGRPTRVRKNEVSPRFVLWARVTIVAVMVIGFFGGRYLDGGLFPYAGTVFGALIGGALLLFGPRLQQALNSAAMRGPDYTLGGTAHGTR
ncbi:hypothetical protein [Streptomyces sp. ODS28]|uniref:hypothetical protein n=1 Tax=Streptomyces sp. ODS28 TaxID=3136688 RepID=UPI0031F1919C